MIHAFIMDYQRMIHIAWLQAKIACIWELDAKLDKFLSKNGDTIYCNMKNRKYVQYLNYAKKK